MVPGCACRRISKPTAIIAASAWPGARCSARAAPVPVRQQLVEIPAVGPRHAAGALTKAMAFALNRMAADEFACLMPE
jgi:hypothetical protein